MAGHSQQPDGPISGINVTPLVDITLVLLIIFMVTAKMMVAPAVPMDLPKGASTAEPVQIVLSVTIPLRRPIAINGIEIAGDHAFVDKLRAEAARSGDVRAVIAADGQVPHQQVLHVLDLVKRAGITRVAFAAKAVGPSGAGPSP